MEDEINWEKMEVDIGEMDLIDEPDVWEKRGGTASRASSIRRPWRRRGGKRSRS